MDKPVLDTDLALRFAREWIAAWNAGDLERILATNRPTWRPPGGGVAEGPFRQPDLVVTY